MRKAKHTTFLWRYLILGIKRKTSLIQEILLLSQAMPQFKENVSLTFRRKHIV